MKLSLSFPHALVKVTLTSMKTAAVCTAQAEPWLVAVFLILAVTCGVMRIALFHPMASGRYSARNKQQVSAFAVTWDSAQDCLMAQLKA